MKNEAIYTHSIAADIVDLFENILDKHNICIPSPEDDEREDGNEAKLYGSVYSDLVDNIENVLIDLLDKYTVNVVTGVFF